MQITNRQGKSKLFIEYCTSLMKRDKNEVIQMGVVNDLDHLLVISLVKLGASFFYKFNSTYWFYFSSIINLFRDFFLFYLSVLSSNFKYSETLRR